MPERLDGLSVTIGADISNLRQNLREATRLGRGFGSALTDAFEGAALNGRKLSDVLRGLSTRLTRTALHQVTKPLETGLGNLFGSALSSITGGGTGGLISSLTGFARGGVVDRPSLFQLGANRFGVAGEAGPEAIVPLARGGDGRLGVRSAGAGPAINITFNVTTEDAVSFRRSEAQISAMVARAVERGGRNL